MDSESYTFISLHCKHCELEDCLRKPQGTIVNGDEGCTRKVSEETAAKYQHYTQEVLPF